MEENKDDLSNFKLSSPEEIIKQHTKKNLQPNQGKPPKKKMEELRMKSLANKQRME